MKRYKPRPICILPLSFALIILAGALLLTLPAASANGQSIGFFDALFTSTSATCVTGLIVLDTGTDFTTFGQVVILLLIQVGGLSLMTMAAVLFKLVGSKVSLYERMTLAEGMGEAGLNGLRGLALRAVAVTFITEGVGFLLLALRFVPQFGWGTGLWRALFHSVSAFCNAGFDLMGNYNSLTAYTGDVLVNVVIMAEIVIGGLGFAVVANVWSKLTKRTKRLTYQTRLVLPITALLIVSGAMIIAALEWDNPNTLGFMSPMERAMASIFQSITLRTAGFNTMAQETQHETSKLVGVIFMLVGGSPAGAAGGLKTTTFIVLLAAVRSMLRGEDDVTLMERRLSFTIVRRALALLVMGLILLITAILVTSVAEPDFSLIDISYELTSALCTVGISAGMTGKSGAVARIVMILLMYVGRIGPVTFALVMTSGKKPAPLRYPEEDIPIG